MSKLRIVRDESTNEYIITIRLPITKPRVNVWEDEDIDGTLIPQTSYPTITGYISEVHDSGLCMTIDMDYKGKMDQYTTPFIVTDMLGLDQDDLIRLCEDNGIPYEIEV